VFCHVLFCLGGVFCHAYEFVKLYLGGGGGGGEVVLLCVGVLLIQLGL